jgi:multicomponent Na+:H+ antiporter subunit D
MATAAIAIHVLANNVTVQNRFMGLYGISLKMDVAAAWFLLLNAVVCAAVAWHERRKARHHYFFILTLILHGCVNACFLSDDLFNLYVVIELTTIVAFLLIGQGMKPRQLWNALRYLFLSNVGMLFFLLGTLLVYDSAGDFSLSSVVEAPATARALIVTGLLVKGGVFLPGLWLPQAHAEADSAVSALLSGLVVNIGLLPLIRLESLSSDLEGAIALFGFGSIFLGLGLGFFQRDCKRLLACSTISQVGFVLVVPELGARYAMAHGIAKAGLFLCAGRLPTRDLGCLRKLQVDWTTAGVMAIAALSIAGLPPFVGFGAKNEIIHALHGWRYWVATAGSVGTAALLTPLLCMPMRAQRSPAAHGWRALLFLVIVLFVLGIVDIYAPVAYGKALVILLCGLALHFLIIKKLMDVQVRLKGWERLEHVVGTTCIALILLILTVYVP